MTYNEFLIMFGKEYNKGRQYLSLNPHVIRDIVFEYLKVIRSIEAEKISFEFTADDSVFFNIIMPNEYNAHIELHLGLPKRWTPVFYNLWREKESVSSGYGKICDIVKEIKNGVKNG